MLENLTQPQTSLTRQNMSKKASPCLSGILPQTWQDPPWHQNPADTASAPSHWLLKTEKWYPSNTGLRSSGGDSCYYLWEAGRIADNEHGRVLQRMEAAIHQVLGLASVKNGVQQLLLLRPVVVLCAESAAHKSEVQLTFGAGSCLLQTTPEHRHSVQFNAQNCLDCVNHPEEGYGS